MEVYQDLSLVCGKFFIIKAPFKDRQHRTAANLQHSRLSLTYSLTSGMEMCTIYDKIDNLERYLGI